MIDEVMEQVSSNVDLKETVDKLHRQVAEQLEIHKEVSRFDPLEVNSSGSRRKDVLALMFVTFMCVCFLSPSSVIEAGLQMGC